jgi:hypothetical protein
MKYLLSLALLFPLPVSAQEVYKININRVCAAIVQIPYASDNFTDEEWEQFKQCVKLLKEYKVH